MARHSWSILVFNCILAALSSESAGLRHPILPLKLHQSNVFAVNDSCRVHAFVRVEDLKSGHASQGQLAVFTDECAIDDIILELSYDESEDFATPASNLTDVLARKASICNAWDYDSVSSFLDPAQFTIAGQSTKIFSTDITIGSHINANVIYNFTIDTPDVFYPPASDLIGSWGFIGNKKDGYERSSRDYVYIVHMKIDGKCMSQAIGRTTFVALQYTSEDEVEQSTIEKYPVQCRYHGSEQDRLVTGEECFQEYAKQSPSSALRVGQLTATVARSDLTASTLTFTMSLYDERGEAIRGPLLLNAYHEEKVATCREALPHDSRLPRRAMRHGGDRLVDANSRQIYEDEEKFDWKFPKRNLTHLQKNEVAENVSIKVDLPEKMLPDLDMVYGSLKNYITVIIILDYKPYKREVKVKIETCHPFDEWADHQWYQEKPIPQRRTAHLSVDIPLNLKTNMKHYLEPDALAPVLKLNEIEDRLNRVRLETTSLSADDMYRPDTHQEWRDDWVPTIGPLANRHLPLVGVTWEKRFRPRGPMEYDYVGEDFDEETLCCRLDGDLFRP